MFVKRSLDLSHGCCCVSPLLDCSVVLAKAIMVLSEVMISFLLMLLWNMRGLDTISELCRRSFEPFSLLRRVHNVELLMSSTWLDCLIQC